MSGFVMDESWAAGSPSVVANRAHGPDLATWRKLSLPPGLEDGEAVRAWILQVAPQERALDMTAEDRERTARWESGVTSESASSLWDLYLSYFPERR